LLFLILIMVVIVTLAALVVTYVAYPHRGEDVPSVPWLGEAMTRAADAVPTLPTEGDHLGDAEDSRDFRSGAGSRRAS
jgi:hypothetical protein